MSNSWFRFYSAAVRNPKVAALSDREFRLWVSLLAASSENDGVLPPAAELKHLLNTRLDHLLSGLDRLIRASLIDPLEDGYTPHNWEKFQYKSDTSTDRVRAHRAKRNVSETPPDTEQKQRQKIEPIAQQTTIAARSFFYDRLLAAASSRGPCHPNLAMGIGPMTDLVRQGYTEAELIELVAEKAKPDVSSWNYYSKAAQGRAAERAAITPKPQAPADDWPGRLKVWREDGTWSPTWGPKPNEPNCKAPLELRAA